jgi:hypothetical protein
MNTGTPIAERRSAIDLQRDGLAGAGGAGDQAVAVGHLRQQGQVRLPDLAMSIGVRPSSAGSGILAVSKILRVFAARMLCTFRGKQNHGRPFQMGQYPAPQGPPGRQARQGFHQAHQGNHRRRQDGRRRCRGNPRLRLAVDKAKGVNMPKDKIDNARSRSGTGELEGVSYEEIRYEGYGIGGAAVMVDCLTDNKTRTVADVRHAFAKYGGNMGTDGSVAFQFKHCGQMIFAPGTDEGQGDGSGARSRRRGRGDQRRRQRRGASARRQRLRRCRKPGEGRPQGGSSPKSR